MKEAVQIVVGLLWTYFIVLPVLFVGHSFQHEPATADFHKIWFENAQLAKRCELCDFVLIKTYFLESSLTDSRLYFSNESRSTQLLYCT